MNGEYKRKPRGISPYFPGEQPVLNVMYPLVDDGEAHMTSIAEQHFFGRRDLFNAGGEGEIRTRSNLRVLDPSTWGAADTVRTSAPHRASLESAPG